MQGVIYPCTFSTPFLSNTFVKSIWVAISLPLCNQTALLCNWCTHNTLDMLFQIIKSCLKTCGIFVIPGFVVITQISSELLTCLSTLFQEVVCDVTFLYICFNFNLLVIYDVLIRCALYGLCSSFQKN